MWVTIAYVSHLGGYGSGDPGRWCQSVEMGQREGGYNLCIAPRHPYSSPKDNSPLRMLWPWAIKEDSRRKPWQREQVIWIVNCKIARAEVQGESWGKEGSRVGFREGLSICCCVLHSMQMKCIGRWCLVRLLLAIFLARAANANKCNMTPLKQIHIPLTRLSSHYLRGLLQ